MTKDLNNDLKFRTKCGSYGLDSKKFEIIGDTIIMTSPKDNIFVFLDEHYNIFGVYDKNDEIGKLLSIENGLTSDWLKKVVTDWIKRLYEGTYDKLPYPFQNLSLKQVVDLAARVHIYETNHGHSSMMTVNGEIVNDEHDNVYMQLLSYIKFLGQQVEQYFMNLYQMKMMGFDYPDVYQYLSNLMSNIDECVSVNVQRKNRPFPVDIIKYLGQNNGNMCEYRHELYAVIDLLLNCKGAKIVGYRELKRTKKNTTDLSSVSEKLLKILAISDEEVELEKKKNDEIFVFNEVNLQSWLSEDDDKDKTPVLKKSTDN